MIQENNIIADQYELDLIESLHNEEWISVPDLENEKMRYQKIAVANLNKAQVIQINIQKEDIEAIKKRSKEFGVSFQSMISALLHNFATGRINVKFE